MREQGYNTQNIWPYHNRFESNRENMGDNQKSNARPSRKNNKINMSKITDYSLNASISDLIVVMKYMGDKVRWIRKMRMNPNKRSQEFWCEYHDDHGHKKED